MSEQLPEMQPGEKPEQPKNRWVLFGIPLCIALGMIEFDRALGGNMRAWVYTFEWPFFALVILYMYIRLRDQDFTPDDFDREANDPDRPES